MLKCCVCRGKSSFRAVSGRPARLFSDVYIQQPDTPLPLLQWHRKDILIGGGGGGGAQVEIT